MLFLIIILIILLLLLFALSLKIKIIFLIVNTEVLLKINVEIFYFINLENIIVFYLHNFKPNLYLFYKKVKISKKKKRGIKFIKFNSLLKFKELKSKIKIGCGDACHTAIYAGLAAGLLYPLINLLFHKVLLQCEPDYSNKIFLVKIYSIIGI